MLTSDSTEFAEVLLLTAMMLGVGAGHLALFHLRWVWGLAPLYVLTIFVQVFLYLGTSHWLWPRPAENIALVSAVLYPAALMMMIVLYSARSAYGFIRITWAMLLTNLLLSAAIAVIFASDGAFGWPGRSLGGVLETIGWGNDGRLVSQRSLTRVTLGTLFLGLEGVALIALYWFLQRLPGYFRIVLPLTSVLLLDGILYGRLLAMLRGGDPHEAIQQQLHAKLLAGIVFGTLVYVYLHFFETVWRRTRVEDFSRDLRESLGRFVRRDFFLLRKPAVEILQPGYSDDWLNSHDSLPRIEIVVPDEAARSAVTEEIGRYLKRWVRSPGRGTIVLRERSLPLVFVSSYDVLLLRRLADNLDASFEKKSMPFAALESRPCARFAHPSISPQENAPMADTAVQPLPTRKPPDLDLALPLSDASVYDYGMKPELTDVQAKLMAANEGRLELLNPLTGATVIAIETVGEHGDPIESGAAWDTAHEAYRANLPSLLKGWQGFRNRNKWVLFDGPKQVRISRDSTELYQLADQLGIERCYVGPINATGLEPDEWVPPDPPAPDHVPTRYLRSG